MSTTAVIPTLVVDPTLVVQGAKLPVFVLDPTLVVQGPKLPTYTLNQLLFVTSGVGGISVGGGAVIFGDPYIPTGGVCVAGSAPNSEIQVMLFGYSTLGGMAVGGSATVSTYTIGGIKISGSAVVATAVSWFQTSGGVNVGGTATVGEHIPVKPVGGITVGGSAGVVAKDIVTVVPVGGVLVSGSALVANRPAIVGSGGAVVSGSAVVSANSPVFVVSGGVTLAGSAIAFVVPHGGVVTAENPYNDIFDAWAINYETNAASRYERLPANSLTTINGVTYVANAGGIYALDAADDAGSPIKASVSLGTTDFGSQNNKHVPVVRFELRSAAKMRLKITTNKKAAFFYDLIPATVSDHGSWLKPAKGLNGLYWGFRLDNYAGADFELSAVSFDVAVSQRSGR